MEKIKMLVAEAVEKYRARNNGKRIYFLSYITKAAEAIVETFFDPQTLKNTAYDVLNDGGMVLEIIEEERGVQNGD